MASDKHKHDYTEDRRLTNFTPTGVRTTVYLSCSCGLKTTRNE